MVGHPPGGYVDYAARARSRSQSLRSRRSVQSEAAPVLVASPRPDLPSVRAVPGAIDDDKAYSNGQAGDGDGGVADKTKADAGGNAAAVIADADADDIDNDVGPQVATTTTTASEAAKTSDAVDADADTASPKPPSSSSVAFAPAPSPDRSPLPSDQVLDTSSKERSSKLLGSIKALSKKVRPKSADERDPGLLLPQRPVKPDKSPKRVSAVGGAARATEKKEPFSEGEGEGEGEGVGEGMVDQSGGDFLSNPRSATASHLPSQLVLHNLTPSKSPVIVKPHPTIASASASTHDPSSAYSTLRASRSPVAGDQGESEDEPYLDLSSPYLHSSEPYLDDSPGPGPLLGAFSDQGKAGPGLGLAGGGSFFYPLPPPASTGGGEVKPASPAPAPAPDIARPAANDDVTTMKKVERRRRKNDRGVWEEVETTTTTTTTRSETTTTTTTTVRSVPPPASDADDASSEPVFFEETVTTTRPRAASPNAATETAREERSALVPSPTDVTAPRSPSPAAAFLEAHSASVGSGSGSDSGSGSRALVTPVSAPEDEQPAGPSAEAPVPVGPSAEEDKSKRVVTERDVTIIGADKEDAVDDEQGVESRPRPNGMTPEGTHYLLKDLLRRELRWELEQAWQLTSLDPPGKEDEQSPSLAGNGHAAAGSSEGDQQEDEDEEDEEEESEWVIDPHANVPDLPLLRFLIKNALRTFPLVGKPPRDEPVAATRASVAREEAAALVSSEAEPGEVGSPRIVDEDDTSAAAADREEEEEEEEAVPFSGGVPVATAGDNSFWLTAILPILRSAHGKGLSKAMDHGDHIDPSILTIGSLIKSTLERWTVRYLTAYIHAGQATSEDEGDDRDAPTPSPRGLYPAPKAGHPWPAPGDKYTFSFTPFYKSIDKLSYGGFEVDIVGVRRNLLERSYILRIRQPWRHDEYVIRSESDFVRFRSGIAKDVSPVAHVRSLPKGGKREDEAVPEFALWRQTSIDSRRSFGRMSVRSMPLIGRFSAANASMPPPPQLPDKWSTTVRKGSEGQEGLPAIPDVDREGSGGTDADKPEEAAKEEPEDAEKISAASPTPASNLNPKRITLLSPKPKVDVSVENPHRLSRGVFSLSDKSGEDAAAAEPVKEIGGGGVEPSLSRSKGSMLSRRLSAAAREGLPKEIRRKQEAMLAEERAAAAASKPPSRRRTLSVFSGKVRHSADTRSLRDVASPTSLTAEEAKATERARSTEKASATGGSTTGSGPELVRTPVGDTRRRILRGWLRDTLAIRGAGHAREAVAFLLTGFVAERSLKMPDMLDMRARKDVDDGRKAARAAVAARAGAVVASERDNLDTLFKECVEGPGFLKGLDVLRTVPRYADVPEQYRRLFEYGWLQAAKVIHRAFVASDRADANFARLRALYEAVPWRKLGWAMRMPGAGMMLWTLRDGLLKKAFIQKLLLLILEDDPVKIKKEVQDLQQKIVSPRMCQKIARFVEAPEELKSVIRYHARVSGIPLVAAIVRSAEKPRLNKYEMDRIRRATKAYTAFMKKNPSPHAKAYCENDDVNLIFSLQRLLSVLAHQHDGRQIRSMLTEHSTLEALQALLTPLVGTAKRIYNVTRTGPAVLTFAKFFDRFIAVVSAQRERIQDPQVSIKTIARFISSHCDPLYSYMHNMAKQDPVFQDFFIWFRHLAIMLGSGSPDRVDLWSIIYPSLNEKMVKDIEELTDYHKAKRAKQFETGCRYYGGDVDGDDAVKIFGDGFSKTRTVPLYEREPRYPDHATGLDSLLKVFREELNQAVKV